MNTIKDICKELDSQSKVLVVVAIAVTISAWVFLGIFIPYVV